ncbi:hypothetical protein ACFL6U_15350 [Planctomycetota bacterium]
MSSEFEWHELIDRHLHGELNDAEKERFAEWLDSDPEACKAFVEQVQWDTQFSEALRERSGSLCGPMTRPIADLISEEETPTSGEQPSNRILFKSLLTATGIAAALLIICSLLMALNRSQKEITALKHELELARHDADAVETDNSATINLYLEEHRDVVARHASFSAGISQPTQMRVSQDDILYYEFFDEGPEQTRPGIIVRGPSSPPEIASSETPVISNGHILTLSEAKETADFELRASLWLDPGYELDQIRRIDGRDALQLLYTDGIHSVSLFEQSLDGRRGLSHQDFREYVVYRKAEQAGGTILAWKDDTLAYVLIGNADMSQLMNIAQSISDSR